jgi:hypothetical protein
VLTLFRLGLEPGILLGKKTTPSISDIVQAILGQERAIDMAELLAIPKMTPEELNHSGDYVDIMKLILTGHIETSYVGSGSNEGGYDLTVRPLISFEYSTPPASEKILIFPISRDGRHSRCYQPPCLVGSQAFDGDLSLQWNRSWTLKSEPPSEGLHGV